MFMLAVGCLSAAVSAPEAETICVQGGGREACLVDTVYPLTGVHVWSMWTNNPSR